MAARWSSFNIDRKEASTLKTNQSIELKVKVCPVYVKKTSKKILVAIFLPEESVDSV